MEVKNSALCVFDRPPVQTDFLRNQTVDYYPLTNVASGGPIEFTIPGSSEEYIDVNDIQLYILAKVTKADGSKITSATDKVALNNLPISTLFQDVSLMLGDTQIEGGQMCYPYLGYFNTVMQFTPMAQQSHMQAMGWFKDEAGKFNKAVNAGFVSRSDMMKDSKTFELAGPLFIDFFRQNQDLISQTSMRLKLVPSKPEFALNAYAATKDFKIVFEEVILYVPRLTLNPSVINGHATGLKKQNAIYPVNHTEVTTFTIPKGQQSYTKDRLFPDQAPKLLMIAMVNNEAFNGSIGKNPFNFKHFNLNKLGLYRDGMSVPGRPFTPDFAKGKVLRSYLQTMRTFNYLNTDDTNGLTPEEFASGYTIYAFDLTADKELNGTHRQAITSKNLRLELSFSAALKSTINVLLYAVYDSSIEITQLRDVITHYTR